MACQASENVFELKLFIILLFWSPALLNARRPLLQLALNSSSSSSSSLVFQHAQKEAHNDIRKSCTMRNHSLCILWMKRRSSAYQVSFTHTPTSYFNSEANGDKKSATKNKPKTTTTRHRVINIVVNCCKK